MVDAELITKLHRLKEENRYTLHDLSRMLDIHISTLERWLKTGHINKVYAKMLREKLNIT
jgi:predicted site-specific integrase-resolvase